MKVTCIIVALFIFTGISSWQGRGITLSRLLDFDIIGSLLLLIPSLLIISTLRHQVVWLLAFIILAVTGFGVEVPIFMILFPEKLSPMPALLALPLSLSFWVVETLEKKFIGVDESELGHEDHIWDEDKIITLDLDANQKQNFRE